MSVKSADEKYFETFDLQLAAGRNLVPADTTREILINETMVKMLGLLSPQEAIGKNIAFNQQPPVPIVGDRIAGFTKPKHLCYRLQGSFAYLRSLLVAPDCMAWLHS